MCLFEQPNCVQEIRGTNNNYNKETIVFNIRRRPEEVWKDDIQQWGTNTVATLLRRPTTLCGGTQNVYKALADGYLIVFNQSDQNI